MAGPLLIDVSCLCDDHTDAALELIHKAVGDDPPGDAIWDDHPNPFLRRLVQLFTDRGLDRLANVQRELGVWLDGARHDPRILRPERPAGAMARWSQAELSVAELYLRSLPPESFTLDDWLMVVDYIVQRYLPAGELRAEADWLATRAALMGRVQAAMGDVTAERADQLLANLPSVEVTGAVWNMPAPALTAVEFGRARCAESVTSLADATRHRLRKLVVDYQEAQALGNRAETREALQTKLLDTFGLLNRDWRRIAVTEATENANQGMVAATPAGGKLRRVEKYRGACPFCRSIDGKVCTVVEPAKATKAGDTEIWVGKTNVGRSASPRRRSEGALIDREPHEMWWIASGAQHPHCRGSWVRAGESSPDPEFEAWLANMDKTRGRE